MIVDLGTANTFAQFINGELVVFAPTKVDMGEHTVTITLITNGPKQIVARYELKVRVYDPAQSGN